MMIHQQDETLTSIQGTLRTLATQAGLIGQETSEQNECVSPELLLYPVRETANDHLLVLGCWTIWVSGLTEQRASWAVQ